MVQKKDEMQAIKDIIAGIPRRNTPPFPIWDATEPSVRVVFHDLVKPADTVFDVGAHIGGLSSVLSRSVGPNGKVISFEASVATAIQLNINLVSNGHSNVTIFHGAVYSKSGQLVSLTSDGAASRITGSDNAVEVVETLQLDELCYQHKLFPNFIKMDIEGAEFDALSGATGVLTYCKPHIVFEHNMGDDRALNLLTSLGYDTFDASRYVRVASSSECELGVDHVNIIAVHKDRIGETPYRKDPISTQLDTYSPGSFTGNAVNRRLEVSLQPGRYVFELKKIDVGAAHTLFSRISFNGNILGQLWTESAFFMRNHRYLPFEAKHTGTYVFEFGEVSSSTGIVGRIEGTLHKVALDR